MKGKSHFVMLSALSVMHISSVQGLASSSLMHRTLEPQSVLSITPPSTISTNCKANNCVSCMTYVSTRSTLLPMPQSGECSYSRSGNEARRAGRLEQEHGLLAAILDRDHIALGAQQVSLVIAEVHLEASNICVEGPEPVHAEHGGAQRGALPQGCDRQCAHRTGLRRGRHRRHRQQPRRTGQAQGLSVSRSCDIKLRYRYYVIAPSPAHEFLYARRARRTPPTWWCGGQALSGAASKLLPIPAVARFRSARFDMRAWEDACHRRQLLQRLGGSC